QCAERRRLLVCAVTASMLLGLGVHAIDVREAWVQQHAAERIERWIRGQDAQAKVYFRGMHGWEFYAARQGMVRLTSRTVLQPGDWLVAEEHYYPEVRELLPGAVRWRRLTMGSRLPLRTYPNLHDSGTPLQHQEGRPLSFVAVQLRDPITTLPCASK